MSKTPTPDTGAFRQGQTRAGTVTAKAETGHKFAFTGDPNDKYSGPNTITIKGIRFVKNVLVAVPAELAKFFTSHNHFSDPKGLERILAIQQSQIPEEVAVEDTSSEDPFEKYTLAELKEMITDRGGTIPEGALDREALYAIINSTEPTP